MRSWAWSGPAAVAIERGVPFKLNADGKIAGATPKGAETTPEGPEAPKEPEAHALDDSGREFHVLSQLDGDAQGSVVNSVVQAALSEDGEWNIDPATVANSLGISTSDAESVLSSARFEFVKQAESLAAEYGANLQDVRSWAARNAKPQLHQAIIGQVVDRDLSAFRLLMVDYVNRSGQPGSE